MKYGKSRFETAQRRYDNMEPPEYDEPEQAEMYVCDKTQDELVDCPHCGVISLHEAFEGFDHQTFENLHTCPMCSKTVQIMK